MGYLISETTREEREQIVADSLGNISANCDGCMNGLAEQICRMYATHPGIDVDGILNRIVK